MKQGSVIIRNTPYTSQTHTAEQTHRPTDTDRQINAYVQDGPRSTETGRGYSSDKQAGHRNIPTV